MSHYLGAWCGHFSARPTLIINTACRSQTARSRRNVAIFLSVSEMLRLPFPGIAMPPAHRLRKPNLSLYDTMVRWYDLVKKKSYPYADFCNAENAAEFHCRSAANPVFGAQNSAVGRFGQPRTED